MTTIRDVARHAGLSVTTVSRALNGQRDVSARSREKVQAAIEALGFRRSAFARGLPGSRSFLICLPVPDVIPAYVAEFQQGAAERCRAEGYHLVVQSFDDLTDPAAEAVADALAALRPEGFLILPPMTDDPAVLDMLDGSGVAYVRLAPSVQPARAPSIALDEVEAARRMTTALLDLGHRRIGFVGGPAAHAAAGWRLEGYRRALAERGLALEPQLVRQGDFSFEGGEAAAAALLAAPRPPTAIFAGNDESALGVMAAARRLGVSMPGDLSVAGFDDSEVARLAWPQLTTVRQPIRAMGAAAAELVIWSARDQARPIEHRSVDFELVFRASAGPPRAGP